MNDENWKEEFKRWKPDLKPFQIKLLDKGAESNSQTLLLSDMWLEWKELAAKKKLNQITTEKLGDMGIENPWNEDDPEKPTPCGYVQIDIDDQLLNKVKPLSLNNRRDIDKGAVAKQRLNKRMAI